MKKKIVTIGLLALFFSFFSLPQYAQTYADLWKKAETYQQKDLPKSVIEIANKIYGKAQKEKNPPQMMKAYLTRAEYRVSVTPDSLQAEIEGLKAWAQQEQDPVARGVLNSIVGYYNLDIMPEKVDSAIYYFRLSLKDKEALAGVTAKEYEPLTKSRELSEKYFGDTMLDLLTRQAINRLDGYGVSMTNPDVQKTIMELYDDLIGYYVNTGNRAAELLTRISQLSYLQGNNMKYPLKKTNEEVIAQLNKWAEEYADLDVCAGVYAYLAEIYGRYEHDYVRELAAAEEGLKRYPKSEFAKELKERKRAVLLPSLSISSEWMYPGETSTFSATCRNLKGVTLELYRLNIKASSSAFAKGSEGSALIKQYGKLYSKQHFDLPATPTYRDTTITFTFQMPEAGIYVLKSRPDGQPDKTAAYEIIHLSPLQALSFPLPEGEREYYVVDRRSGQPVPGAEIAFYSIPVPGNYTPYRSFRTDNEGRVVVPKMNESMLWMNARKGEDDFMRISYVSGNTLPNVVRNEKETQFIELFTDRIIYRPGQTVYVSGVAYKQSGDEVNASEGRSFDITLRDANNREISKKQVTSDDFGGFSTELQIPQQTLPGDFRISTENSSLYVRVEEYKRPTFDVTFTPYEKTYNAGDTVTLEGTALNFSGVPVRSAKVKYTITRSTAWFWRASGNATEIGKGETTTDSDGRFRIQAFLEEELSETNQPWESYLIYKVNAEITGGNGETQSGDISLPVGKQSIGLQIQGLQARVAREKQERICIQALNLNRQPVNTKVTCEIYAAGDKEVLKLTQTVDAQKPFVPTELYSLPSGKYRIKVSATDEQGRISKAEQEFTLFSLDETVPPIETPEWFYQDGTEFTASTPVTLYVGSSEKDVCLFYNIYSGNKRIHSERITLNNEIRKFSYIYKPEYGDGITVSFAFMRDGKLYTKQVSLRRPEPEKELTLKWDVFRDKLTPGTEETWSLTVFDKDGKPADSRLIATLYDASLDRLLENQWNFNLNFYRYTPSVYVSGLNINTHLYLYNFFGPSGEWLGIAGYHNLSQYSYLQLPSFRGYSQNSYGDRIMVRGLASSRLMKTAAPAAVAADGSFAQSNGIEQGFDIAEESMISISDLQSQVTEPSTPYVPLRENFAETAFFYPDLRTDSAGRVRIVFTMPDALTEWKFIGFAHTQQMDYGMITAKAKTSKPFMVQPNMPRFVRVGDRSVITASLNNLSMETISGKARMELLNPTDEQVVYQSEQPFTVKEGENGTVSFEFEADERFDVLICRIVAEAGKFSDGEQHYLPVLTNKQRVTETIPVQLSGEQTLSLPTDELFNGQSKTATDKRLTIELTANPEWYVVQALPVVGNPTDDNAISWVTSYYANAISAEIVRKNPAVEKVFNSWMAQGGSKETLLSNLERNQDLKNILLAETPWLAEATDETEQKRRIALLFDLNTVSQRSAQAVKKLASLQNTDGSWSWYKGMAGNRIVTTQAVELLARLKAMNIMLDAQLNTLYVKATQYLTATMELVYEQMKQREAKGEKNVLPDALSVRYLYVCALDNYVASKANPKIIAYLTGKLENRSAEYSIYEKALTAAIMQANGKTREASELVQSIKEYTIYTPEMGRYFDTPKASYSWSSYRIPTQVAAMEAIHRISPDKQMMEEMKLWLLKQKQTQAWNTPIATADAVYAFLCTSGNTFAANRDKITASVGTTRIQTPDNALDYTRHTFSGSDTEVPEIRFEKSGDGISWGAVYAQYSEDMDKIESTKGKDLSIKREYWLNDKKVSPKTPLSTGDKLTVRLTIKADRDMDFIQIKDSRAACMEPTEQLSGYRMGNGIGYYQVNRDASTEFFIDKLRKGTHIIEYTVYVDRSGTYQAGTATVQSAYAPEFGGHSESMELNVGKNK